MLVTENINLNNTVAENFEIGLTEAPLQGQLLPGYALGNGTAIGQIDLRWELGFKTALTLAASASVTYTLSALTDEGGRAVAFARVKKLIVFLVTRTDGDFLTVGGASSHAWTAVPTFEVYDLEAKVNNQTTAFVVTASSSDQLKITNSGSNSITFQIALSGCSV